MTWKSSGCPRGATPDRLKQKEEEEIVVVDLKMNAKSAKVSGLAAAVDRNGVSVPD